MIYASAPGKVNLHFEVGPLRDDGYHSVLSLYQGLALRQRVGVQPSETWQVVTSGTLPQSQLEQVPLDENNLVVIAAKKLAQHAGIGNPQPMRFETTKQVPVAAGLAGGSADAAAALVALNEAWCLGLSKERMREVASQVGADVPFSLLGGTAIGVDTGIELTQLAPLPTLHLVLAISPNGLSTAAVFKKFDELFPVGDLNTDAAELAALVASGEFAIGKNSLLQPAIVLRPELSDLMQEVSFPLHLSGSGPTLFFASADESTCEDAARELNAKGISTIRTKTDSRGAELD